MRRLALIPLALLFACDSEGGGTTVCIGESCGSGGGFVPSDDTQVGYGNDTVDSGSAFGGKDGGSAGADGAGGDDAGAGVADIPVWDTAGWGTDAGSGGDAATPHDAGPVDAGAPDAGPAVLEKCSQIISCTSGCAPSDALCHTACDSKATGEAKQALADYEACSAQKCEPLQGEEYLTCMLGACLDQVATCWTGGSATCATTVDCSLDCIASPLPQLCLEGCAANTSADEFKRFVSYTKCLDAACQTEGALCAAAATFLCHDEASQCGLYQGGGDCSDMINCLPSCTTAECIIGCQKQGKASEGSKAKKLLDCMIDECGEAGTSQCAQQSTQGKCSSQSFSCFF
ncbi:MAG: hypothetical protein AMXMBFR64_55030 [Myxococcales bacterium]